MDAIDGETATSAKPVSDVETNEGRGLSPAEAARRLKIYGENRISTGKTVSPWTILGRQFLSPLVLILLAAAVLAATLGEGVDAAAIAAIVVLNALLGFVQEWRAERAIEALRNMLAPMAEVIRDGVPLMVPATELVPGDLVVLGEGQKVPADIALTETVGLRLDESVLTGESVPVDRTAQDPEALAFMGTLVVGGRAQGVVTATGAQSRFGKIAELTGSMGEKTTRLQHELTALARQLGVGGLVVAGLVFLLGLASGRSLVDMALTSLSMAVAVVPEGLPVVVTLTLAIGASAMVRRKALLRRLQAAETLGAASVICTDKTGTLTENKMTATDIWTPDNRYSVTGTGYDPAGQILRDGRKVRAEDDPNLHRLLFAGQIANNARLEDRPDGWTMIGDPTEGALITLAYKGWVAPADANDRLFETPFSSERKRMSTLALGPNRELSLFVKGAPEAVLSICETVRDGDSDVPLDAEWHTRLTAEHEALASEGLRVIAIAARTAQDRSDFDEARMTLLGFIGLLDPPRPEIASAVALCKRAGIRVIMITGDSPRTGAAIAERVGIAHSAPLTGPQIDEMSDGDLSLALQGDVLFARAAPVHKMRIVERLQQAGAIVAMTGDGVNDAPALRKADIGVAMGTRGTDVAKEASDLVILDDNFATIVGAIEEGRRQYDNIRKFVRYLLSANLAEVIALTVSLLIGGPLMLLPIHILWMNLLTDGISAVALGLEPGQPEQMERPPISPTEHVLSWDGASAMAAFAIYMAGVSIGVFYLLLPQGEEIARTAAFTTLVLCQEVAVFAFRSETRTALSLGFARNPWLVIAVAAMILLQGLAIYWPPLGTLLGTVPLAPAHLGIIASAVLPLVVLPSIAKILRQRASS